MNKKFMGKQFNNFALAISSVLLASTVMLSPVSAQQILPDGTTQTSMAYKNLTTDIYTSTIQGNTAFNSFKKFSVHNGTTVNLHVPSSADKLVNLVFDEKTNINGILNGMQNGQIGGNIVLINPHGITVGAQGVVNVGSLTAICPTQEEMENLRLDNDSIRSMERNRESVDGLMLNPEALIQVKGKINALDFVRLEAGGINVSGTILTGLNVIPEEHPETIEKAEIGGFNNSQIVKFGEIVNVPEYLRGEHGPRNRQVAGSINLKADNFIRIENGQLIANNVPEAIETENIKMEVINGGISADGIIKGEISAEADSISLILQAGDTVINKIDARTGDVLIAAPENVFMSEDNSTDHHIKGNNIYISSRVGDLGKQNNPLMLESNMDPNKDGAITLHAGWGSVNAMDVSAYNTLVDEIEACDNVHFISVRSILNGQKYTNGFNIMADNVTIQSVGGSIGTYGDPLKLAASNRNQHYTPDTALNVFAGASHEVVLQQDQHNMKAFFIESEKGLVDITIENGDLLDGNQSENPNIVAQSMWLSAKNGNIGQKDFDIDVQLTGSNGTLTAIAGKYNGLVNIENTKGDLKVNAVSAMSGVRLVSDGDILDGSKYDSQVNVESENIQLHSYNGSIGSLSEDLDIHAGNRYNPYAKGILTASAQNGYINLEQHNGDLYIDKISAQSLVNIKASHNIYSAYQGQSIDVSGHYVQLITTGSIGTAQDPLGVKATGLLSTPYSKNEFIKKY